MGRVSDEATRHEYYRVITRESERLSRLIENVLDFSRIEGGRRTYDLVPVSVEPLVRDTVESFAYVLAQQGFKVDVAYPGGPARGADGRGGRGPGPREPDRQRDQVLRGAEGPDGRGAPPRTAGLALTVGDEGIGIPREEQGKIFDKFYRVGRSETQGRRGSGVGLALVRHVAEAHGGRVGVDSQPGEGSRFTLWLPLSRPAG